MKKINLQKLALGLLVSTMIGFSATCGWSTDLKTDLETSYQRVRASLQKDTPDEYLTTIAIKDKEKEHKNIHELWKNPQVRKTLNEFVFMDLKQTTYLETRQEGDFAGYYYRFNEPDGKYITISLVRFHKVNGVWKPMTSSGTATIPRETDEAKNKEAIQEELKTSSSLTLIKK